MAAKPLTAAEKAWLKKLQAVFDECPSDRLGAYTIGDAFMGIYDSSLESEINAHLDSKGGEFCMAVEAKGADFIIIKTPFAIHSTAG